LSADANADAVGHDAVLEGVELDDDVATPNALCYRCHVWHIATLADRIIFWTRGRIYDLHVRCVSTKTSRTHHLATAFDSETGTCNALSPYVKQKLETLLQVTERKDWEESNLHFSAYEVVNIHIKIYVSKIVH